MEKNIPLSSPSLFNANGDEILTGSFEVAQGLARLLVLTRALCRLALQTQQQPKGPEGGLQSLFEQHYQSLRKAVDIIAARIGTLGYELPSHFAKAVWGNEESASPAGAITSLIKKHTICAREARKVAEIAEDADDGISGHIASQRAIVHERAAWLLSSLIENKPATRSVM